MRIGTPARRKTREAKLRDSRVQAARRNAKWVEIEADLIPRDGGRVFVSAGSDRLYKAHTGVVFERGSSNVIADQAPLHWYARDDDELVFLELLPGTWSERYEKQLRRQRTAS